MPGTEWRRHRREPHAKCPRPDNRDHVDPRRSCASCYASVASNATEDLAGPQENTTLRNNATRRELPTMSTPEDWLFRSSRARRPGRVVPSGSEAQMALFFLFFDTRGGATS